MDFVILDMGRNAEVRLLLGRPFLHTTKTAIYVSKGVVALAFKGQTIDMPFNGYIRNNPVKKNQPKKPESKMTNKQVWLIREDPLHPNIPKGLRTP